MCHAVECADCRKTSWVGCGMHVDSVMKNVKPDDRCNCPRTWGLIGRNIWKTVTSDANSGSNPSNKAAEQKKY